MKLFPFILLILACLMLSLVSMARLSAQSRQSRPIVLREGKPQGLSHFTYYADPGGLLTVKDILRDDRQDQFQAIADEPLGRGYTDVPYWLSVVIRNETDQATWYLAADHPLLEAAVYRFQSPESVVQEAALEERYAISRVHLPPHQETRLLIKASSRATLSLQFRLMSEAQLARELHREALLLAVIAGCFLAMILYNFFLYLSLRDRDYLFYLFFAIINCHLDLMTVNFPAGIWTWMGIPWWDFINIYRLLAPLATLLFARSFLQLETDHPKLNRAFLLGMGGLILLMLVHGWVAMPRLMTIIDLYFLVTIVLLFFAGFSRFREKFSPARFYLAGLGIFLLGVVVCLWQMMGWLPTHPLTVNAIMVAQAVEMILMSLALGGKVKLLQGDKMRAEVTAQIKGHLLRIISHDIANPLTVVKAHSRRLQKELPASKPIESIVRGVSMIEEIMHFVRKTESMNQGMAMSMTAVSLAEVFGMLTFLFQDKARDKGIELKFSLESPDLAVRAEKVSLSNEVLGNLLSNAIKFSSPGGLVHLDARKHENDSIVITVQDHGVGMNAETLARLFDPYQNRSEPGTAGEQGIGYGMPLAKALLDAYAALIEVDSTPITVDPEHSGTVFRIFIRAA